MKGVEQSLTVKLFCFPVFFLVKWNNCQFYSLALPCRGRGNETPEEKRLDKEIFTRAFVKSNN